MVSGQGHTLPVGECKFCGSKVAVSRNGTLRRHGYAKNHNDPFSVASPESCEGSFKKGWALDVDGNKIPKSKVS